MNKTQRAIAIGILVLLAALGTGWTLARAPSHRPAQGGPPASDSTTTIAPVPAVPESAPAAAPASSEEYDRSDLLLSQG
jgi:hypothetical protein